MSREARLASTTMKGILNRFLLPQKSVLSACRTYRFRLRRSTPTHWSKITRCACRTTFPVFRG